MIGYRDMTFCCSKNCQNKCGRKITDEVREGGKKWWGSKEFPISVGVFCDEQGELI